MSLAIRLHSLRCIEEVNEGTASEEPYVLVTSVSLRPSESLVGPTPPAPNFEVFSYGIFEDVDAGTVVAVDGAPFWGPSSTPQELSAPDQVGLIVSLMENDNGVLEQYKFLLRAVVPLSLVSTVGEENQALRAARLASAISDALNGVNLPFPFTLDDDHVGTQQLVLDGSDLLQGGIKDKSIVIQNAQGRYELVFRITAYQPDWQFCGKCKTLFFNGDPTFKGNCPAGGIHEAAGLNFALEHDRPEEANRQPNWMFCSKCASIFFNGDPGNKGACAAGNGHTGAGFNFVLLHDVPPPPLHQDNWRFCGKCMSLFFGADPNKGVCARPAPSSHEAIGLNFFLPFDAPAANRQPDWRFCGKCKALYFAGDPANQGACSAGGPHQAIGSNFHIPFDSPGPNRQEPWRFCGKCRSLFFDGDPGNKGACPAGAGHEALGHTFFIPFDSPGQNMQGDWRFCGKCMTMFFNGDPNKGVCARPAPSAHEAIGANFVLQHI